MKCFMSGKECEYRAEEKPLQVFIISPFGYPFDDLYKEGIKRILSQIDYSDIYKNTTPILMGKLEADKADQALQLGFVMCQRICRKIQESQFILADISKPNPNVFYELGLSYGMNKKIILIGQKKYDEAFTFGLTSQRDSYIHYRSLKDFENKALFIKAFKNAVKNSLTIPEMPESKILNIVNENATIQGLHEKALRDSIYKLNADPDLRLKNEWEVITRSISFTSNINEIIDEIKSCKICVIDSSVYGKGETDINPYLFFCLGLGHGFHKEVVPLTNTPLGSSNVLPFDVKGLWHIFYNDLEQLKSQFMGIMPQIDKNWNIEQEDYLYKKTWNPFLRNRDLHIMTCARDTEEKHRGPRTNIDKWDYTTVSELSHFLALKYPKAQVTITPPISKLENDERNRLGIANLEQEVSTYLCDKDCIIIGSPDVSDLAEIVLSRLHKIEPYKEERLKFNGYVIIKTLQPNKTSSFYWEKLENETEGIYIYDEVSGKYTLFTNIINQAGGEVYGILTIANNPFVSPGQKRKIMILSGFSGVATYGIARLLTDEKYKEKLREFDENYIDRDKDVEILISTKFSIDPDPTARGDKRIFKDISFKKIITI